MTTWLDLPKPWLFLAPMAGVADWAFREICYRFGAEITVSHLVPVAGLIADARRVLPEVGARHGDRYFLAQLVGHRPEDFERAARIVTEQLPVAGIDINMGCPVSPVVSAGSGSALMRDPARAVDVVRATCAGTSLPVSVKLRSGWDRPVAAELAPLLAAAGAKALAIHARTRAQHYRGPADWDVIRAVKGAVSIPVVGNGGVVSVATAREMLDHTGADGLMLGRGALGNPWLFADLQSSLKGTSGEEPFDVALGAVVREHVWLTFADLGPRKAPLAIRKHLIAYCHGSASAAPLRKALETLRSPADIDRWVAVLEAAAPGDRGACRPQTLCAPGV